MKISPFEAIDPAMTRMKTILFSPFDIKKWFGLGFCAFLAGLIDVKGGGSGDRGDFRKLFSNVPGVVNEGLKFLNDYAVIIAAVGIILLCMGIALTILLYWLSCRGKFMFISGVANNNGHVAKPWNDYRESGNNLMKYLLILGAVFAFIMLGLAALGILVAWSDIKNVRFGPNAVLALAGGIPLIGIFALMYTVIIWLIKSFMVPTMYQRKVTLPKAYDIFKKEILPGNLGPIFLFGVMQIVFGIGAVFLVLVFSAITCFIGLLLILIPIIGSVVMLPISVFLTSYNLCFLEQFGEKWKFFNDPAKPVDAA